MNTAFARLIALGMLKHQLNTGKAFGRFFLRTGKNHITHRAAAQLLGRGFTQYPTDGINRVGFAAAIRPNNRRDGLGKVKGGRIGEGFKACKFKLF